MSDLRELMHNGELYITVHTKDFPNGEISGYSFIGIDRIFPDLDEFEWSLICYNIIETPSTAECVINFKTKNDMLTWKMNVTGANDPTGINIHKGKAGDDGEIVVDLMKVSKHSDTPKGMIMRGNVTESSLTGSMAGQTIADLKTAMANGDTYVNLKTQDHPDGLMKGQIN